MPPASISPPAEERRRRPRGEKTAERILDVAEALFAERGFEGTALRDVAERVGIRIPSLYNHFASKEALYAAVLERCISPVVLILDGFVETASRGEAPDVGVVIERVMQVLSEHPQLPRLIQHETVTGGQRLTDALRQWIGPVFGQAATMVDSSGEGLWEDDETAAVVLAMYHVVAGYFAIAPFYKELSGLDLLAEEALAVQTRVLLKVVQRLFPGPEESAAT